MPALGQTSSALACLAGLMAARFRVGVSVIKVGKMAVVLVVAWALAILHNAAID
ncbi:MAG: hypothetical protein OSA51_04410 [Octadecabacter sp.]|nr:hypothetical protein [Octadecabacter sp.]